LYSAIESRDGPMEALVAVQVIIIITIIIMPDDNVYGAVIMTQVIWRFHLHPVHLTNVGQRQAAADPQIKSTDLGCESTCRLLLFTSMIQGKG